jgi:hypothetical protein
MAAHPLARALKDFGVPSVQRDSFVPAPVFPAPDAGFPHMPDLPDFPAMPDLPPPDDGRDQALIDEAVAQAENALRERLEQEHADALQIERDRHAEEIAELHVRFADESAERIKTSLDEMEQRLVELTSAVTARILGVVLTDDVRQRSIERLAGLIRDALGDADAVRVRVRGSLPLFETLKEKLPEYADQLDYAEGPGVDLAVTIDDSVFETRLAEWSAALAEVMA